MARPKSVKFSAADDLVINGDLYVARNSRAFLVLCHRSHFNRGEYAEIAPRLVELGYSCLAIDQRSGMNVLGHENGTYQRAKKGKLATGYVAARPDIEAAVRHAAGLSDWKPLILVGSSYSASLALVVAATMSEVNAVAAFSPGEYLKGVSVADSIGAIAVPTFVTAAREELDDVKQLTRAIPKKLVTFFSPEGAGAHGARCLWKKTPGHEAYWNAFTEFLAATVP